MGGDVESKHEQAERDYLLGMKYKDIATKYGVSIDTVKAWKRRYWKGSVRADKNAHKQRTQKSDENKSCVQKKLKSERHKKKATLLPMITNDDPGLNERQRLFCLYFVNNRNATQAYLKAYGCSWATANTEGAQHLANPRIRAEINRLREIKAQSIMLGPDDIVERMMRIGFADMTDVSEWGTVDVVTRDEFGRITINQNGEIDTHKQNYMHFKNSDSVDGCLVSEVSMGRSGLKVKLEDRHKALEWLAKWFDTNPMDKHKRAYDNAMLEIRRSELKLKDW